MTDGVTVMSLSASLQHNIEVTMDCSMPHHIKLKIIVYRLCQVMLNQTSLHKFEKWCKFSSHLKANFCKKKSHTKRPACIIKSDHIHEL